MKTLQHPAFPDVTTDVADDKVQEALDAGWLNPESADAKRATAAAQPPAKLTGQALADALDNAGLSGFKGTADEKRAALAEAAGTTRPADQAPAGDDSPEA